ncbi:MAG: hypothetical protein NC222_06525 [Staphylococcus sp.]|nr:hypothetical protein [Staphylococcus sp.]
MTTKKLTKKEKVFNLLKSGKNWKASSIAKKVYGDYNTSTASSVRSVISILSRNGYNIELVDTGTYKMK